MAVKMTNRNFTNLWHRFFVTACVVIFASMAAGFGVKLDESYIDLGINLNSYILTDEGIVIYYMYIVARVIAALYALYMITRPGGRLFSRTDYLMIIMFLWALVSSMWSIDPFVTLRSLINILLIQLIAVVAADRLSGDEVINAIWWAAAILILYSFVVAVAEAPFDLMEFGIAWSGLMPTKNIFGGLCGIFIVITFSAGGISRRFLLPKVVLVLVGFFALTKSGSIGAIISLLFSMSVVYTSKLSIKIGIGKKRSGLISLFTVGIAFLAVGYFAPDLLSLFGRETTFSGRTALWQAVLPLTTQFPLGTGYGLAGGDIALGLISQSVGSYYRAIDNAYIVLAVELGWGMVFVYAIYLISIATRVLEGRLGAEIGEYLLVGVGSFTIAHAFVEKTGGPYFGVDFFVLIMIATVANFDRIVHVGACEGAGRTIAPTAFKSGAIT